jgi:hypothetical protein
VASGKAAVKVGLGRLERQKHSNRHAVTNLGS